MLTIGSLFSGIGGLELGLERAGLGPTLWQAERDVDARAVLAWHWPKARRFKDVRELDRCHSPECETGWGCDCPSGEDVEPVNIICGGFPCQDLSSANVAGRVGLDGARSGLWSVFCGVVAFARPDWVVVENVGSAWREWVPVVRGDLGREGYSSVPLRVSPAELGFLHHRDRVFIVAYAHGDREPLCAVHAAMAGIPADAGRARERSRLACHEAVARRDGLPAGLARLPGNAVVPAVAELIGRGIATVHRSNA